MEPTSSPASQAQQTQSSSLELNSQIPKNQRKTHTGLMILVGVMLLGVTLFIGLFMNFNWFKESKPVVSMSEMKRQEKSIALPTDAILIQSCATNKGALYVKSKDIPTGPVYMVNNGNVIGIEFMLDKDDFLKGESYKYLDGKEIKINHVNIGLLSQGHGGFVQPHYHVDLYVVDKKIEESIKCNV